jgi:hypothetical protein
VSGGGLSRYCRVAGPARGSSILGRTEPDLHLIKQVEQVTIPRLERPAWRYAAIPSEGTTDAGSPRISDLAITALAVIWLQKQPGAAEGDLSAKRQSGKATDPTRRFHRTRSAKFAETDT